jgi:release factor glutamine methyltransferase
VNWRALKEQWITELGKDHDVQEIESWFFLYLERVWGGSRRDYLMNMELKRSAVESRTFQEVLKRLLQNEPIQHIIGSAYFHGDWYEVNEHVLIPRPETEDLVDILVDDLKEGVKVLDMGTGSGCIPIALKRSRPDLDLYAIDVSEKALKTAKRNSDRMGTKVSFHQISMEFELPEFLEAEALVSNPPYVPESERSEMAKHVAEKEPDLALFVPNDDPLKFYDLILDRAFEMKKAKYIYWEFHPPYRAQLEDLCVARGVASCTVRNDRFGRERMMIIRK